MNRVLETKIAQLKIRFAEKEDAALVFRFIKELCQYEKMLGELIADEDKIYTALFEKHYGEVIFPVYEGEVIGFALFFTNFSTFQGKSGLFLEDLYIREEYRGKGIGKAMLSCLAKIALDRDCTRFEWRCLNWNQPSIDFYEKMGAKQLSEWLTFRMDGKELGKLAEEF